LRVLDAALLLRSLEGCARSLSRSAALKHCAPNSCCRRRRRVRRSDRDVRWSSCGARTLEHKATSRADDSYEPLITCRNAIGREPFPWAAFDRTLTNRTGFGFDGSVPKRLSISNRIRDAWLRRMHLPLQTAVFRCSSAMTLLREPGFDNKCSCHADVHDLSYILPT
jgi:hypothetical protein